MYNMYMYMYMYNMHTTHANMYNKVQALNCSKIFSHAQQGLPFKCSLCPRTHVVHTELRERRVSSDADSVHATGTAPLKPHVCPSLSVSPCLAMQGNLCPFHAPP